MNAGRDDALLIEGSPDVLSKHSERGVFLHASPACRTVFGYEPGELVGRSLADLAHAADAEAVRESLVSAAASDEVTIVTYRIRRKDGRHRWIETTSRAWRDPSTGEVAAIVCASRDVTARKSAEQTSTHDAEQARLTARRLSGLIETIPGAVWETWSEENAAQHRENYISDYIQTMTGYSAKECLDASDFWTLLLHPEDTERLLAEILDVAARRGKSSSQVRFITKDGRTIWIESYMSAIKDTSGATVGVRGVAIDITARKEAERENAELLRRARQLTHRNDNLIASIPGIVWELSSTADPKTFQPTRVSDYVTTMVGYSALDWAARPEFWLDIIHPDDKERARAELREIVANGSGVSQYRWITKDERAIWVETHLRVLHDEAGARVGIRGVSMDVTARKLAEEEQARLRDEIIRVQAESLAELGAPLIPLSDEVMVMPLVGALDQARAENVIQALLHGMGRTRAQTAILDITGVPSVDTRTADALIRAAKAVQLLGAEVVLTGIRPEVAQTLITMGTELTGIVTRGTLKSGIAYAMRRR